MLTKVKSKLQKGLHQSKNLHSSCDQFDNLTKYLKIYTDLAQVAQNAHLLKTVVPAFLSEGNVPLRQLTQRVTTHGLTAEEAN